MVDYNFGDIANLILIHDDLVIAADDFETDDKTLICGFLKGPDQEILNSIETKSNTVAVLIR